MYFSAFKLNHLISNNLVIFFFYFFTKLPNYEITNSIEIKIYVLVFFLLDRTDQVSKSI